MALAIDRLEDFLMPNEPARFNGEALNQLLIHAKQIGASDLYLKSARPVTARWHGRLVRLTARRLEHTEVVGILCEMYGGANADLQLRTGQPIDQAYSVKVSRQNSLRFRWCATGVLVNGNFGISLVLRELAQMPPKLQSNQLHPKLLAGLSPPDGLILVTGETGAGKSTLLASLIREIAEDPEADAHIITFEAPIEYIYDKVKTQACEIDQSAIPDHLGSFAAGIRNALRRDPDVILVGEARDAQTIKAAILAAQTGHRVYTTVHSNSVATTFLRLLQALPVEEQHANIASIIDSIRVIISQQLLPSLDGYRCAVREFLVFDNTMRHELLNVAAHNLSMLPKRAAELVVEHGQSMLQHVQELAAAKHIHPKYVELISASQQVSSARLQSTITAVAS